MKKLLFFALAAAAVAAFATDYPTMFNDAIAAGRLERADSVLRQWEASDPADAELYPARFNLLLNRARCSVVELSDDTLPDGAAFILTDSAGNKVGSMAEREMRDDSIYHLAIAEIGRGIDAWPDRLDFRLAKAGAASFFDRWDTVAATVGAVLDRGDEHWRWTGGALLGDSAKNIISNAVFDYVRDMYMAGDSAALASAVWLGDKGLVRFPENVELLNLMGGIAFEKGDAANALRYMERASGLRPCDGLVRYNIAYVSYTEGDTARALSVCREMTESDCIDEESKEMAAELEHRICTPLEPIRLYDYFFRWLPAVAEQARTADADWLFGTPVPVNDEISARNGLRSPFSAADIEVSKLEAGGREMYVWTFPMPTEVPMCRYVAFVPDGDGVRYYTFEKSIDNYWVTGAISEGTHSNFGGIDTLPADAEAFAKFLAETVLSHQSPAAVFRPDGSDGR